MNRLDRFKQKRNLRQKYFTAAFLFLFLLTSGILLVDESTNFLLSGKHGIRFVELNQMENRLEIVVMNEKLYINTQYIQRDLKHLKDKLHELLILHP